MEFLKGLNAMLYALFYALLGIALTVGVYAIVNQIRNAR
jgi:hypothetical protein